MNKFEFKNEKIFLNGIELLTANSAHPVDDVYISISPTDPGLKFGGTWEELPENLTLWLISSKTSRKTETISAGLPNITGKNYHSTRNTGDLGVDAPTGAFVFKGELGKTTLATYGNSNIAPVIYEFDASISNSIYGNSSTVQPPAFKVYGWKRIL